MPDEANAGQKGEERRSEGNGAPGAQPRNPLIVAIGASAGGLDAFRAFFSRMPPDSGMGFVLIQHLDPYRESHLPEILSRETQMQVLMAEEGAAVAPNTVHVIPPNTTMTISGGRLRLTSPTPPRPHRWPIDSFFNSLAEDQGENAVCIVLCGVGSDGTVGLAAVKAHGGLTLAQSEFDHIAMSGMPASATATGAVDYVMRVEDMPGKLIQYHQHLTSSAEKKDMRGLRVDISDHLATIITLLRSKLGHDFSQYKTSTLIRRIQRRMQVLQIDRMEDYVARLRHEPPQIDLLFNELLIGVTQFMRDPAAFEALQGLLPGLLESGPPSDPLRVWVPGCSSGEEVYSIAILLKEAMERVGLVRKVQIFGTDIDDNAIAVARVARYPKTAAALSPDTIRRWFTEDGDSWCLNKSIREMCIFSTHSLVKDPPFSRMDLISCRNVMIYLNADLQEAIIRTFHYALRRNGILFLGPSEGVTRSANLFVVLDGKHRLYRRRETETPSHVPIFPRNVPMPQRPMRPTAPLAMGMEDLIEKHARSALERHSPAYVVVNERHDILRFSGGEIGRYLEPASGAASLNLFTNLRKALRPAARAALQEASMMRLPVVRERIPFEVDGQPRVVTLIVEPIADVGVEANLSVLAFRDMQRISRRRNARNSSGGDGVVQALEAELASTKARLQAALEAAEGADEDRKSTVEEYQSINEELQSSNEELETAKEEMQSINEELQTINVELSNKNDQLTRLNNDVQNLLESTQIATIFLDAGMRIKDFTPAMKQLFHLRGTDHARPLSELANRLAYDNLWGDVASVLRNGASIEREVQIADSGATFIMRILPYNTIDHLTEGVVLTFVDITARKKVEAELRELAAIIEFANDAFIGVSFEGMVRSWNPAARKLFGYDPQEVIGKPISMLAGPGQWEEQAESLRQAREGIMAGPMETVRRRKDGTSIEVEMTVMPIRDGHGQPVAIATAIRDISDRRNGERQRELLLHELSHRVKNALATVQSMAVHSLRNAADLEGFRKVFLARLIALSKTHDLLTTEEWQGASLREVLELELSPYQHDDRPRWKINGENIRLTPKAALAFGMAFHELATNAVKYGALSASTGRIEIGWHRPGADRDNPRLSLSWVERDGPAVSQPSRKGFGSRLITEGLAYELNGEVRVEFAPEGFRCVIDIPLKSTGEEPI